jgi:hypothetical protein
MSPPRRVLPRLLLVAVVCWFPLQYRIVHTRGEPYPALIMPPFPNAGVRIQDDIAVRAPEFVVRFSQGAEASVSASTLANQMPEPARLKAVSDNFGPDQLHQPEAAVRVLEASPASALPGRALMWARLADPSRAFKARDWLAARCGELFPGRRALSVTVRWHERTVQRSGAVSGPRLVTEATIPLPEAGRSGADDSTRR